MEDSEEDLDLLEKTSSDKDCKNSADDDLLLLSPSPSPNHDPSSSTSEKKKLESPSEVLNEEGDMDDLEILEVKSVPGSKFVSASESSESESEESEEESEEEESDDQKQFVDGKINIFVSHGSFFLWNIDDVQMLREECRIIGKLIGCLPRAPRQNVQLGLPLQLMPEEAKLLVDIEAASLVVEKPVSETTVKSRKAAFENVRQQNFHIQQRMYKDQRKEDVSRRMDAIIAGKKAKKRKLNREALVNSASSTEKTAKTDESPTAMDNTEDKGQENTAEAADDLGAGESTEKSEPISAVENSSKADPDIAEERLSENSIKIDESSVSEMTSPGESNKDSIEDIVEKNNDSDNLDQLTVDDIVNTETSIEHSLVQLFTESPWRQSIQPYRGWSFPSSERELLRYLVFKDLWGKGFYLTSGAKFGGDFLVYPGDPSRYHSHYIAICRNQFDEAPCLDLVSLGRLASNVRKTALLCALNRNRKVTYTSLTWTGIS